MYIKIIIEISSFNQKISSVNDLLLVYKSVKVFGKKLMYWKFNYKNDM